MLVVVSPAESVRDTAVKHAHLYSPWVGHTGCRGRGQHQSSWECGVSAPGGWPPRPRHDVTMLQNVGSGCRIVLQVGF